MRRAFSVFALLAAMTLAACSTPSERAPETNRETPRAPGTLPDAYKHPPP